VPQCDQFANRTTPTKETMGTTLVDNAVTTLQCLCIVLFKVIVY